MAYPIRTRLAAFTSVVVLASSALFAQANVAGSWTLEVDSPQGATKASLMLALEGEAVTGSITSDMGESKFTGTAKEGTVTFSFDIAGPQGPMTISAKAAVTGDDMKGELDYGMGVAPFTGKREGR